VTTTSDTTERALLTGRAGYRWRMSRPENADVALALLAGIARVEDRLGRLEELIAALYGLLAAPDPPENGDSHD